MSESSLNLPRDAEKPERPVPSPQDIKARARLYAIAYDEGKRAVDDQGTELANIRQRAVQYLAFVGSATAFLAAAGIRDEPRDALFYSIASVATTLSLITVFLVSLLLRPSFTGKWKKRMSSNYIIAEWIEGDIPTASEALLMRELALRYDDDRETNENTLGRVRGAYMAAVATGGIQLILWVVLVWIVA